MTVEERLAHLAQLRPGWNDPDSKPVHPRALEVARKLLTDKPHISPCEDGGLLLTWTGNGLDLEIWIEPINAREAQWSEK